MNKNFIWKIHNWLGLYTGIIIVFLSITGAAALFRPEIDRLLNPELTKVADSTEKASLNLIAPIIFLNKRNYFKSFSYFLRNIHVRFYEAYYGRQIVGLAGIALFLSTITGLLIYGKFMKKQPFGKIRKSKLRITQADIHKLVGISTLAFNLMIGIRPI